MTLTDEAAIVIPVTVNGRTVNASIDSGSSGGQPLTISKKLQTELNLQAMPSITASAYGGDVKLETTKLNTIIIGGLTLHNRLVDVAPDGPLWDGSSDMVVGQEFLLSLLLQVDWERRRIRFLLTGDMPATSDDVSVLLDRRINHLIVPVTVCGIDRQLVLDSGLENDVNLNPASMPFERCSGSVRSDRSSVGLGGRHIREIIALPTLRLGSRTFPDIIAGLEGPNDPLVRTGVAGSVGYGTLRRSNFVLDAGNGKLRFYGPDRSSKVVEPPTVGIQFTVTPDALTIVHLMSNSPASRAALKVGDRICTVDGKTIKALRGHFKVMNPAAGTTISLGLCVGRTVRLLSQDYLAFAAALAKTALPAAPEPAGIGRLTEALARCEGKASQVAVEGCSTVIASTTIPAYYRITARLMRVGHYDRLERHTDALADANASMAENGENAWVLSMRAQSNTKLGRYQEAGNDLDATLAIDPTFSIAYVLRAALEYKLKRYDKGIEASKRALALAPGDHQALNMLALGYLHQEKFDFALIEVEKAIATAKDYSDGYATRGQIREKQGQLDLARSDFEQALKIDPANADAVDGLRRISTPPV